MLETLRFVFKLRGCVYISRPSIRTVTEEAWCQRLFHTETSAAPLTQLFLRRPILPHPLPLCVKACRVMRRSELLLKTHNEARKGLKSRKWHVANAVEGFV